MVLPFGLVGAAPKVERINHTSLKEKIMAKTVFWVTLIVTGQIALLFWLGYKNAGG